jgi:multidrug efflux pump subunit AcrA (membrane-fusion protein)
VVFVATGKHQFRRRPVQVQYVSAGQAAIAHGLQTGERVVSQGAALLESDLHVGNVQGDDD